MAPQATVWVTESRRWAQTSAALGGCLLGGVLVWGSRRVADGSADVMAASALGWVLIAVGLGLLIFDPHQVITINNQTRRISLREGHRFGARTRQWRFDDIADVTVGEAGDREGGSISYHLVLTLKSGETTALFTGFFDGRLSRAHAEARRARLLDQLRPGGR